MAVLAGLSVESGVNLKRVGHSEHLKLRVRLRTGVATSRLLALRRGRALHAHTGGFAGACEPERLLVVDCCVYLQVDRLLMLN